MLYSVKLGLRNTLLRIHLLVPEGLSHITLAWSISVNSVTLRCRRMHQVMKQSLAILKALLIINIVQIYLHIFKYFQSFEQIHAFHNSELSDFPRFHQLRRLRKIYFSIGLKLLKFNNSVIQNKYTSTSLSIFYKLNGFIL